MTKFLTGGDAAADAGAASEAITAHPQHQVLTGPLAGSTT